MDRGYSIVELHTTFANLPEEIKRVPINRAWLLSLHIINHFLGRAWLESNIGEDAPAAGLYKWDPSDIERLGVQTFRSVDLAESLFNLQFTPGFSECVARLRAAKNPEFSLAELHIAKMLYINDWQFRFVVPVGRRGNDYDFEIYYEGQRTCADAKCKIESTPLSAGTITNTLSKGRDQLPADGPGIFFVKIPQSWLEQPDVDRVTAQGALDFFAKGTGRVVSVKFYVEPLHWHDDELQQGHFFMEILNPRRRYGREFDWKLFERWKRPPLEIWNALPPKWLRLTDFPRGILR